MLVPERQSPWLDCTMKNIGTARLKYRRVWVKAGPDHSEKSIAAEKCHLYRSTRLSFRVRFSLWASISLLVWFGVDLVFGVGFGLVT